MNSVYIAADNILTSLGFTTGDNMAAIRAGKTGIVRWEDGMISPQPFWASRVNDTELDDCFASLADPSHFTRFEKMVICSVDQALKETDIDPADPDTLFVLSSTKGNIHLLNPVWKQIYPRDRVYLWSSAELFCQHFKRIDSPVIISNACISGLLAIIYANRQIHSGSFRHAIVTGADLVTEFVLSGFNSFMSLSNAPCKPFDRNRQGLSLGEGAGTLILTADRSKVRKGSSISLGAGFSSNDANHISGPSRTGEGLFQAIYRTLEKEKSAVDFISAHGTATPYNDEMESIALTRNNLQNVPVNSFKGYWGHTLGAAGVIETIAAGYSLSANLLIKTLGYEDPGTTNPLAVIAENRQAILTTCLKIASGFGGCNAALMLTKR